MVFTDLLFIFAFLPTATVIMLILNEPWEKNLAALALSLVFILWGHPWYFALILIPVITTYAAARLIEKNKNTFIYAAGSALPALFGLVFAILSGADSSLKGAILSVSFLLFALKSAVYLGEVKNGSEAEKDFLSIGAFLVSYEFMLISPAVSYSSVREGINSRKVKLSNMAVGMRSFILGLGQVAIPGLSCDRVRLAALHGEAVPWMNSLIGLVVTALEAYIIISGYQKMSAGLSTINGVHLDTGAVGIFPRSDTSAHLRDVYPNLEAGVTGLFAHGSLMNIIGLCACSLIAGVCLAMGVGEGAFLGLVLAGIIIMCAPADSGKTFEKIFTLILTAFGFVFLACGSLEGIGAFISSLDPNAYEFDISYALYEELGRVAPWLVIGAVSVTPMPTMLAGLVRSKMADSPKAYTALRLLSCIGCVGVLVISVVALVSYR